MLSRMLPSKSTGSCVRGNKNNYDQMYLRDKTDVMPQMSNVQSAHVNTIDALQAIVLSESLKTCDER